MPNQAMSIRRILINFRRFFRRRTFCVFVFTICVLLFIFATLYSHRSLEYRSRVQAENIIDGQTNKFLRGNRVEKVEDDELLHEEDSETVFKRGVLGNFEPKEEQIKAGEFGEMGQPVLIEPNLRQSARAMREYGFNTYVSDMISLNRSVPDARMEECKYWSYPEDLPTASVVIVFHNEGWSPLLRTVHSVILRTPEHLLKEVLLVDDFSDKKHLKESLEDYIKNFNGKVRLIRNEEREGLIRTRSKGAQAAFGDVVIFLDAHCEVNINWLPPLLAPIRHNRKVMTVPVIDGIDMNTWAYRSVYGRADRHFRGIFEWGLLYKETEISAEEKARRKHPSEPFRSPTHAGGLLAIDRKWFGEIGYYDPGLQIWGGEQYELSFKIWQCGGGILFVPCSHVGHVYRSHMPYGFGKLTGKPIISTNMLRVIHTWMDEYSKYYYIREPSSKNREPSDISAQLALRKRLNCKSFKWYMEKVAYDVVRSYPLLPENHVWGEARNPKTGKCIDTMGKPIPGVVGATACHGYGGHQVIRLNKEGQLTQGEWCISLNNNQLITGHCVKGTVNGPFAYDEETKQIKVKEWNLCLTADTATRGTSLSIIKCDRENPAQVWEWREIFVN